VIGCAGQTPYRHRAQQDLHATLSSVRAHPSVLPAGPLFIAVLETPRKGRTHMASTGKKKTTMAKLARESRLRERRLEKEARKQARKQAAAHPPAQPTEASIGSQQ
jgi:hypothetical protein